MLNFVVVEGFVTRTTWQRDGHSHNALAGCGDFQTDYLPLDPSFVSAFCHNALAGCGDFQTGKAAAGKAAAARIKS